ncbi:hypothetical protein GCM10011497_00530 [Elstera cyanobacteriorum]|uniref:Flagellum biosynthesis protein FlbT n=1 Tax=Elstera cyanobacteriorum TaxID=2022747 RepID=A0A255XRE8_9PROT|nr:flagellar biosynthesis repressor FlbT [Elstera cyanobacteriorum]OYQ18924.1 hypothetical protein CHR90_11800 [Elstera cyanobacteriorum]GFZ76848.1 hypothetical protein GCM10011497_00530 [Elstera cyanobacteriorum]
MPLKMTLKPGERIIVNGAVLENGGGEAHLVFLNDAAFMREKDILAEVDALTPASRIYFALQCLYIFPARRDHYGDLLTELMADYLAAAPSAVDIIERVKQQVSQGEFYHALKTVRALIAHEKERLDNVSAPIESLSDAPPRGESGSNPGVGVDPSGKAAG